MKAELEFLTAQLAAEEALLDLSLNFGKNGKYSESDSMNLVLAQTQARRSELALQRTKKAQELKALKSGADAKKKGKVESAIKYVKNNVRMLYQHGDKHDIENLSWTLWRILEDNS